jgi:CheY-like chemotaxis protein
VTKKILLVSDNATLHQLGSVAFEIVARWRLSTVRSVSEALATAKTTAPDAILIDTAISTADQVSLAKTFGQDVPVISLASNAKERKRAAHDALTPQRSVAVSEHPRTLATDVAEVLGWQPPCASGRWKANRGTAA